MKLYKVDVWCDWDSESGATEIIIADSKENAERKSLVSGYYNSACAEEIQIEGYRILVKKFKERKEII